MGSVPSARTAARRDRHHGAGADLTVPTAPGAAPAAVERFAPIEGLRAWLAWGVFFGHIALFAGLSRIGIPSGAADLASDCVQIFIIVSGFVITHLLLAQQEGYPSYIARRFFRLFPAFVVS